MTIGDAGLAELADRYDPAAARRMIEATASMGGIPGLLGLRIVRFAPGKLWAEADLADLLLTPHGHAHGGAVGGVLDHITGAVVYPLMPDGWWGATVELLLTSTAPVGSGSLHARATVLSIGRRSAVVRGEAHQGARLVCAAQGTIALVAPRSAAPTGRPEQGPVGLTDGER